MISADELKVYDRQLRLWGVSGQMKLSESIILVIGGSDAIAIETAKNLTLAGTNIFYDSDPESGQCKSFVGSDEIIPKLRSLNPLVSVETCSYPIPLNGEIVDLNETLDKLSEKLKNHIKCVLICGSVTSKIHPDHLDSIVNYFLEKKIAVFVNFSNTEITGTFSCLPSRINDEVIFAKFLNGDQELGEAMESEKAEKDYEFQKIQKLLYAREASEESGIHEASMAAVQGGLQAQEISKVILSEMDKCLNNVFVYSPKTCRSCIYDCFLE
eukprot:GHVP01025722.1.p1 GENE.GHVP01025722.1~~GHVP01025722.1.p1  ORF type:complete len:270 (-),score=51.17 GHVP01025722.1:30-839(-)